MFKWEKGRQNSGYEKMLIYQFSVFGRGFDCYLLRYNVGDSIPLHTDPVPFRKHFRLNYNIRNATRGGYFMVRRWKNEYLQLATILHAGPFTFFRSDIIPHYVTEILEGQRLVLTFGAAI